MHTLSPEAYSRVLPLLEVATLNTLFARAVIARVVSGEIFVDQPTAPEVAYIRHPYGMALLVGKQTDAAFNRCLRERLSDHERRAEAEWVQIFPLSWQNTLARMLRAESLAHSLEDWAGSPDEPAITLFQRINFRFDSERFEHARKRKGSGLAGSIIADPIRIYEEMRGAVIPRYFWDCAEDFAANGAGRSLLVNGEIAATAFAAFCLDGCLELGIETAEKHRGQGYAFHACAALIDEALDRGLEPVWSCREDNAASRKLAHSLGFIETQILPCFRLPSGGEAESGTRGSCPTPTPQRSES